MKNQRLNWTSGSRDSCDMVHLSGDIDEDANLAELAESVAEKGHLGINLRGIHRINSVGVREWVGFIRKVSEATEVTLEECSPAVVTQLNMITGFAGNAAVKSVLAPYVCDACGAEENVLIETSDIGRDPDLGSQPCPKCSEEMELDDLPESYFAFAADRS